MKKRIVEAVLIVTIAGTAGCTGSFQSWQQRAANKLVENKKYKEATELYSRVMRRAPSQPIAIQAARSGARVAVYETKDFSKAAEFYRHLVLYSPDQAERLTAQRALTGIYFENLLDYDQALVELNHLIPLLPQKERAPYQLMMARSYFNLNNYAQALVEIEELLAKKSSEDLQFESLLFKGNLLQATKKLDEAIKVFNEIRKKFPERAENENIGMSLAICYEEKGELNAAIEVLEDMKKTGKNLDFIQVRIHRLKERTANLPGAGGLKR